MKLAFYSGEQDKGNKAISSALIKIIGNPQPRMTFIPASSYDGEVDFNRFVHHFKKFGVNDFLYFPVDVPSDSVFLAEVLKSDLIHLGGGNTFYFLHQLRSSGMLQLLKEFVQRGGVLSGLSAGAIIMTPHIGMASYPKFDCDHNSINLRDFSAMGLVDFEFFPHYPFKKKYREALINYSLKSNYPIFACDDGHGLIVDGDKMIAMGKIEGFFQGLKIT